MKSKETRYPDYPLFKGLQRPLEVMGLQGRYIYWAAFGMPLWKQCCPD